jgi:hypothetical protein
MGSGQRSIFRWATIPQIETTGSSCTSIEDRGVCAAISFAKLALTRLGDFSRSDMPFCVCHELVAGVWNGWLSLSMYGRTGHGDA